MFKVGIASSRKGRVKWRRFATDLKTQHGRILGEIKFGNYYDKVYYLKKRKSNKKQQNCDTYKNYSIYLSNNRE